MMLLDAYGEMVVDYTVDAWGRVYAIDGSMANTLGVLNPLIYRGYVYDHETGLYYLNSRYYDPEIGRFINADALISTGQGLLGNNMFAYCRNNPVARKDVYGTADVETYLDDGSDGDIQVVPKELDGTSSFAYAYNPIDAGYSYGVNMSQAANSSLVNGGLYANGYVAYNYYANPNNSSANSTIQNNNPLVNVSYTNKVISDMQKSDYHGFSMLVDNHGALGKLSILQGGDKNTYFKLMIPGSYLGHDGYFTYIWNTKGQCNHRCFEER